MYLKNSGKALALSSLMLAAGCSSVGGTNNDIGGLFPSAGNKLIKIESDPPGATVYVMGKDRGVTPLKISNTDVFPNIYPKEKESLYGKVTLKKSGCTDVTRAVNADIIDSGLRAKLDCGDLNPTSSKNAPRSNETVEQRLEKIKYLLSKGLISEEEAKKAREHIINDL
jgi:hypothetical protein